MVFPISFRPSVLSVRPLRSIARVSFGKRPDNEPIHIVLIEDTDTDRLLMTRLMPRAATNHGCTICIEAPGTQEAVEAALTRAKADPKIVVLMDQNLSKMGIFETGIELVARHALPLHQVIMTTDEIGLMETTFKGRPAATKGHITTAGDKTPMFDAIKAAADAGWALTAA